MQATDLKQGMWVEHQHEIAEVISIDPNNNTVIIENQNDHQRSTVSCEEIPDQPQLHAGCDRYY
ncbi:hypothetical protein [Photobacterium sanguinicancri]|uniref:Malate dehydrogenase n=1 Tax=Photobacterium sanguinicancri TaxID=875932 RepID=A0AAW7YCG6_9GAMM|nr:hypothetical protein [Photobacterium sanguinicancri]KXI21512.1 malate dehydrogenase [Photobacterium sanguinicancri]MDO6499817.1 hypothetical protein [Photobacterium sanguinicancri]MDO6545234.1 hypothetical protein [Photobacterium sanguinicancri]OZS45397.1 hypothetical protein ASV53_03155 [Photobacterium sanguinicancri]